MRSDQKHNFIQNPWLKSFNVAFNFNENASYKNRFCAASIHVLKTIFTKNKFAEDLIKKLNVSQSNQSLNKANELITPQR